MRSAGEAPEGTTELVFDVTDAEAIARAAAGIERLDALVDNAGIAIAAPLEFLPPDELTRQLDVNVVGQLRVLQAFLPALRETRGRVVLMGSIAGRSALPFLGAYAMSKFALEAMADALRVELAPWGMHVVIVEPGHDRDADLDEAAAGRRRSCRPQATELYGERLDAFRRARGRALVEARRARRRCVAEGGRARADRAKPKTRYVVGPDAKRRARVQRLPDRPATACCRGSSSGSEGHRSRAALRLRAAGAGRVRLVGLAARRGADRCRGGRLLGRFHRARRRPGGCRIPGGSGAS